MPAETEYGAMPVVRINGNPLPDPIELLLEEVAVHDHLHLPDMVEIRFRDDQQEVLGRSGAAIGAAITVSATSVGRGSSERPLFEGEITALESEYEASSGTHTVLRGYDKVHRLMKQRHTRAFLNLGMSDIVNQIGQGAGLQVQAAGSAGRYEHIAQVNETSWDFLQRLARESGYEVSSELGKLLLREPPRASGAPREGDVRQEAQPLQVVLGTNLRSLRVRITAASQVRQVNVRAWDYKAKRELVGQAAARTASVEVQDRPEALAGHFGATPALSCDRPLDTQGQVDAAARSLAELIAASSAEAYGTVDGNPALKAGEAISIAGAGDRFNGKYLVTATRHVFDEEGFRTLFEITGRHERSVLGLTGSASGDDGDPRVNGVVVAIVTNNRDPDKLGRVKVKYPWLSQDLESWWARIATLDAGDSSRGSLFLPEVNDEVLVAFEHGDFRRPYVVGRLWNGVDKPPTDQPQPAVDGSGKVVRREVRSRLGHVLRFNDGTDRSGIELVTADGKRSVNLDQHGRKLLITIDQATVEITDQGAVSISCNSNVSLESQGNVTLKSSGNLKLEAAANVEIKGAMVKVEGSGTTEIKGGVVRIN